MIKINIKKGYGDNLKRSKLSSANDDNYQKECNKLISSGQEYTIKNLKNGYACFVKKK